MMDMEKDRLKELFHEIKPEIPSDDFMKSLMIRIEKEAVKKQRKHQIYNYLFMFAGVICIICIPALVLFLFGINISFNINILNIFQGIHITPSYLVFALIILLLLMGDTLLRKKSFGK